MQNQETHNVYHILNLHEVVLKRTNNIFMWCDLKPKTRFNGKKKRFIDTYLKL